MCNVLILFWSRQKPSAISACKCLYSLLGAHEGLRLMVEVPINAVLFLKNVIFDSFTDSVWQHPFMNDWLACEMTALKWKIHESLSYLFCLTKTMFTLQALVLNSDFFLDPFFIFLFFKYSCSHCVFKFDTALMWRVHKWTAWYYAVLCVPK